MEICHEKKCKNIKTDEAQYLKNSLYLSTIRWE